MRSTFLLQIVTFLVYFSVSPAYCGEENLQTAAPSKNPSSPVITYQNGELTIEAHHSKLSEILYAVSTETGAAIDLPAGADRPVAGRVGPGQPVDVLARMLKSLGLDYAIIGSVAHPKIPVRVILFPRPVKSGAPQQAKALPPAQPNLDSPTNTADMGEAGGVSEVQQEKLIDRLATVQQDLMERLNARGKQ